MDFLNAIVLLLNYLFVPFILWFATCIRSNFCFFNLWNLRFAYFTAGDLMSLELCLQFYLPGTFNRLELI